MKLLAVALAVVAVSVTAGAQARVQQSPAQSPDKMMGEELYAAYLVSGPDILSKAFPTNQRYDDFRTNFRDRVFDAWGHTAPAFSRAMFMFDVSLAAQPRGYVYWADFLQLGQTYLRKRLERSAPVTARIGTDPEMDAFELQWNKTAISFLAGRRQPDLVDTLARPLIEGRIVPALPSTEPALVDPWIALLAGFIEEGYILEDPARIGDRGAHAIAAYEKAVAFESTRAEATVRTARLLLDSKRPSDALAALDRFDEAWTDEGVLIYWARLLRGKALAALDRPDQAVRAYESALEIVASAQSPRIGIMAIEAKRGRAPIAEAISKDVRTAVDPVNDPWWIYAHGSIRYFPKWEKVLREMASK
jgi:tetratricopeptide (TPR) repeat protein